MAMNKDKAFKILSAKAPTYKVGVGQKKAFNALKNTTKKWNTKINTNMGKYNAMGDFDPAKSAYYQSAYNTLKGVYQNRGRADMQNAMAAAAANTGGFGNSYGTTAGNLAYQERLQELAGKVPSLYSAASSEFAQRKSNLANLIGMQQTQQGLDTNNAQFMIGAQQALDEQRHNSDVNYDNALRKLAEMYLTVNK